MGTLGSSACPLGSFSLTGGPTNTNTAALLFLCRGCSSGHSHSKGHRHRGGVGEVT
jgi:hypothetical protein